MPTAPMVHRSVGYDAAKMTKGRKRHLVVDTLGLMMAAVVTAANVTERDGGQQVGCIPVMQRVQMLSAD
ncbi:MAG: transposase [Cyanobacteria bacterium REEB459]|nr:transposase [Cyanobacteria bacterium REEB459]